MPAAFDLAKLYQYSTSLRPDLIEVLGRLDPLQRCMGPAAQLALGVLSASQTMRSKSRAYMLADDGVTGGQTEKEHLQGEIQKFIRALLRP